MLVSRTELDSLHGRSALAILLIQDIAVVPLVLLVGMLGGSGTPGEVALHALNTIGVAALLVVAFILIFNYLVPRLLGARFISRNRELPILLAIITALGSAWAAHEANLSPALGAFVAGMLLAGSPFAVQIRADVTGLRTLLVTLFFAAVGMYANPAWIIAHLPAVLGLVAAIVLGKALIMWILLRLMGQSLATAAATGVCLAQVGEFSFVLAGLARSGDVISEQTFLLFVSGTIITLVLTPYLIAAAPALGGAGARVFGRPAQVRISEHAALETEPSPAAVLIIGFGPAGRIAAETLRGAPVRVRVLDLNPSIAAAARECGCVGHVGDATHPDVLSHAQVAEADVVAVTLPDPAAARRVIRQVRAKAPRVYLIARARYHVSVSDLQRAGADVVVDEEETVGRRLAEALAGIVARPPHDRTGGDAERER
jgi:CPA2 family monovalent cation:H+ antiporter-2